MNIRSDPRLPRAALGPALTHSQALAEAQLRDAAVRVTAARIQVLAALLEARSAVSHQDIQDRLAGLDRVTLYRALDCLTDAALAHKIAGDDRIFRYSAGTEHGDRSQAHAQHPHGHFKCTRCARVFCLDDGKSGQAAAGSGAGPSAQAALQRQLQDILRQTLGAGFESHDIELTIKGWCADCAACG
jgi:Fur family ferric uptake transcriptional regulator